MSIERRQFVTIMGSLAATCGAGSILGQENTIVEPVHRVANAANSLEPASAKPLDRALQIARDGLTGSRANINDYTALMVKREQIGGALSEHQFMHAKVRNRKVIDGKIVQPLSVYLKYLKPTSMKGREVIYVEDKNDGNLVAHEGGFKGRFLPTVTIPPDGMLAMRGQRYPITEIGVENLIVQLLERGKTAKKFSDAQCEFRKNARIKDRACTVFQMTLPTKQPELDFYQAQVFIDDQFNVPIRYIAYDWPIREGAPLQVLEEYNYLNMKVNVGLTDADFDRNNKAYGFN